MNWLKKIITKNYSKFPYVDSRYEELPIEITKLIHENDYIGSYMSKYTYIIQLLTRHQENYNCTQLEYDIQKNRFLTREERELKVPKDRILSFLKYDLEMFIHYYLEEKTDELKVSYQIYSLETKEKIEDETSDYFWTEDDFETIAELAYKSVEKEKAYKTYTDKEKATVWSSKFYSWMRQVGEGSMDEIEMFEPILLERVRKEEPRIDELMPLILTILAGACMTDVDDFFKEVNDRLKTSYAPKS